MDSLAFCHFLRGELRKVDARREARAFVGDDADTILAASNQPDHYCAAWASGSAH